MTAIKTKTIAYIGILVAFASVLWIFESLVPRLVPWLKPGLANMAGLIALWGLGFRAGLVVTLVRILVGSLISGSFSSPAFLLSLGGGVAAILVMGLAFKYLHQIFSIIGISIMGAVAHNLMQLVIAYLVIVGRIEIFYLLPIITLTAAFIGFMIGIISFVIVTELEKRKILVRISG